MIWFWLVRHLPFPAQNTHFQHYHHPRPIILDPHLRLSPTCKLIINAAKGVGVAPWVISAAPSKIEGFFANEDDGENLQQWEARRDVLQAAGVTIIIVDRETIRPSSPPLSVCNTTDIRQILISPQQPPIFPSRPFCAHFVRKASAQSWSKVALVSYSRFSPPGTSSTHSLLLRPPYSWAAMV
jgi:hypothetical protein